MKIVQLNSVCGAGSTGNIALQISKKLTEYGIENYVMYALNKSEYINGIRFSGKFSAKFNAIAAKIFGNYGFNSYCSTKKILKQLDKISPDIVHIHNIHSHEVNLSLLFKYLKQNKTRVIITMHDCWFFTGYCMHFDSINCNKWRESCNKCPLARKYSLFFDKSQKLFLKKKQLITDIDDVTVVSPSKWLADIAKKSFLSKYPIEVINNGIDLDVFKRTESDFRKEHNFYGKKIVLGIPKGRLDAFIKLNEMLGSEYIVVLVGLNQDEIAKLPPDILGLPRKTPYELAKIFSAADVFVNTTLEDTFPTVNLEALACGTPVITYNTGGSPEAVDENTGIVVEKNNITAVCDAIAELCKHDMSKACIDRAKRLYNGRDRYNDYIDLYKREGRFK